MVYLLDSFLNESLNVPAPLDEGPGRVGVVVELHGDGVHLARDLDHGGAKVGRELSDVQRGRGDHQLQVAAVPEIEMSTSHCLQLLRMNPLPQSFLE